MLTALETKDLIDVKSLFIIYTVLDEN